MAGTNGKGSVVALAGAVLREAGYMVGAMPKPHLVTYRERITINGQAVGPRAFASAVEPVLDVADRVAGGDGPPTEFEVLTAAGFLALAEAGVDVALVEVGLGGRLDATNAADLGVAVITNVAHDHERHLGRTLAAIGREKAAIVKACEPGRDRARPGAGSPRSSGADATLSASRSGGPGGVSRGRRRCWPADGMG